MPGDRLESIGICKRILYTFPGRLHGVQRREAAARSQRSRTTGRGSSGRASAWLLLPTVAKSRDIGQGVQAQPD